MATPIYIVQPSQQVILLGRSGENEARIIQWDITNWVEEYGTGTASLLNQRNGDAQPYPVAINTDGTTVSWLVTSTDTSNPGTGQCELQYIVGGAVVKSRIWPTEVKASMAEAGPVPDPQQGWVDQVIQQTASNAQASANSASQAATSASGAAESEQSAAKSAASADASAQSAAESAQQAAEAADGLYYSPDVSQPSDNTLKISWTGSKESMPEVPAVSVVLPQGPEGPAYTLTEADKEAIVQDVLAALPNAEGVGF